MTQIEYNEIEIFMLNQMQDSAHDKHHVYRVLNSALDIANCLEKKDISVLIASCLLHDIGREKQFSDPNLCHAQVGGDMAYEFLLSRRWAKHKTLHVKECISTHRYRGDNAPQSIEAKILFDADKLDVSGAMGIARTLFYKGQVSEPLYDLDNNGHITINDKNTGTTSFFQEYNYKLKNVYNSFYTKRAKEIALSRQKTAVDFYNGLFSEISTNYENGINRIKYFLDE